MPNVHEPEFEDDRRHPGFVIRRARLARQAGSERLGMSLFELPPGEAAYPYHFHFSDEELILVLRGRPTLRAPEGSRELEEGERVRFPVGPEGAHQLLNHTGETATFVSISSSGRPDVVIYPDSDKIGVGERLPHGGGLRAFFRRSSEVSYWDGEQRS